MVGAEERGDHLHAVVPRPGVPHQSSGWNVAAGSGWAVHKPAVSGVHAQNTHTHSAGQHYCSLCIFLFCLNFNLISHPLISSRFLARFLIVMFFV